MDSEMITVTIDGKEVKVSPGTTVLEAARSAGIHIPTLCHHDDLCREALYSQTASAHHEDVHDPHKYAESGMLSTPRAAASAWWKWRAWASCMPPAPCRFTMR